MLKKIMSSPWLNFFAGFILLISAGYEVWQSFENGEFGVHHGIFIFGIIHVLKTLSEVLVSFKEFDNGE